MTEEGGPWAWVWLDDSPHGETYAVRDAEGIVAYTSRTKAGYERAVQIAEEHNVLSSPVVSGPLDTAESVPLGPEVDGSGGE